MDFLKKIQRGFGYLADYLVYSRLWLAVCTFCLCSNTFLFSGMTNGLMYTLAATSASYTVYSIPFFHYYRRGNFGRFNPRQKWIMAHLPFFIWLNVGAIVVGAYCALQLPVSYLFLLAPALLLAIAYILPVFYWKGRWRYLREYGALKPLMIATVWSYVCVLMPFGSFVGINWMFFLYQFTFLFIIGAMFDNRDVYTDTRSNIRTLPILFGKKTIKTAIIILSLIFIALLAANHFPQGFRVSYTIIFSVLILYNSPVFGERDWRFYDLMVDGVIVLQFVLNYIFNK